METIHKVTVSCLFTKLLNVSYFNYFTKVMTTAVYPLRFCFQKHYLAQGKIIRGDDHPRAEIYQQLGRGKC